MALTQLPDQAPAVDKTLVKKSPYKNEDALLGESSDKVKQSIAQFGFKTEKDIHIFLDSPAGETIKEEMGEIINKEQEYRQRIQDAAMEQHRQELLILALLLHHYLESDEEKQKHNAEISDFIDKHLKANLERLKEALKTDPESSLLLKKYDDMAAYLHENLNAKETELEGLNSRRSDLAEDKKTIDVKYTIIRNHQLDPATLTELSAIQKKLQEIDGELSAREVKLGAMIENETTQESELREYLSANQALNLQRAMLQDMIAVVQNEKQLVNAEGNTTTSFTEAKFILNKNQKLVKDGDDYLLIPSDKELNELSSDAKVQAGKDYLREEPNILMVNAVIDRNERFERETKQEQIIKLDSQADKLATEIRSLKTKLQAVQQAKQQTKDSLPSSPVQKSETNRLSPLPGRGSDNSNPDKDKENDNKSSIGKR